MADQEGYIKIDRNILRWGWYKDIKTCHLFLHLLMKANYKDGIFMGRKIKRGQLAASYATLAHESGLSYDEVRTALRHLKSTGEAQSLRTPQYLVITIVNYDQYQTAPKHFPITSQSLPNQIPITSQQEKESKEREERKKGKKGRSAPGNNFSEARPVECKIERDEYGHIKLPPRDKGTVNDIPTVYRDGTYGNFTDFKEFYDFIER